MQGERISAVAAAPQKRLMSIMLVAAIHVVVIYGLFMALKPVLFTPPPQGPMIYIPDRSVPLPPSSPNIRTIFRTPDAPPQPVPPVVTMTPGDIGPPPRDPAIGDGQTNRLPPLPVSIPARSIAWTHKIPAYPAIAARLNEQGSVRLMLRIDEQGNVVDAEITGSSGFQALDAAAVAWVKEHWRYQPATRDGTPIPSSTEAIVTFQLTNRRG